MQLRVSAALSVCGDKITRRRPGPRTSSCSLICDRSDGGLIASACADHRVSRPGRSRYSRQVYEDLRAITLSLDDVAEFTGALDEDLDDVGY